MIKNEQIAFIADALLALCEKSEDRPHFSDEAMQFKLKVSERRDPIYGAMLAHRKDDPLYEQECRDIMELARLTNRQSDILILRLEGHTFGEIGRLRGHTKQAAQRIFLQSLKKLAHAHRVYTFKGMSEVYRAEVRRGVGKKGFGTISKRAA